MKHILLEVYGSKTSQLKLCFEIPEKCSLNDLLQQLDAADRLPKKFGKGKGFSEFLVFVNGENVMVGKRLSRILEEDDKVVIIPAMAGG